MANLVFLILGLIVGLLVGYWGQAVYNKLRELQADLKERRTYEQAGIVRPNVRQITQVDLTSPSGGVRRPSPDEAMLANIKERDAKLKQM